MTVRSNTGTTAGNQIQSYSTSLHTVYGFLMTLLGTVIAIKCEGSSKNPFKKPSTVLLLLGAIFSHAIALVAKIILQPDNNNSPATIIFHFSGILACETLFWVLVVEYWWWWIIINALMLLVAAICFYDYIFVFLKNHVGTSFSGILKSCKKVWGLGKQGIVALTVDAGTDNTNLS